MRNLLPGLSVILAGLLFVFGLSWLMSFETKLTDDERLVKRGWLGGSLLYVVNTKTQDEVIRTYSFLLGDSWSIEYDGACSCLTEAQKIGDWALFRWDEEAWLVRRKLREKYYPILFSEHGSGRMGIFNEPWAG